MTHRVRPSTPCGPRRWAAALSLVLGLAALLPTATPAAAHSSYRLLLEFDSGETLAPGSTVVDSSGQGNEGVVRTGFGGQLEAVTGWKGNRHARWPDKCDVAPCPTAAIRIPDSPSLDPEYAPFKWGVHLRLDPSQTSDGSNLLQKGLWDDPGGQWKLEVDGADARPRCVVSGYRDGTYRRVVVTSRVSVATGSWTRVTCWRTETEVLVVVHGQVRGWAPMEPVLLSSSAPVTVGAKYVSHQGNDQFHGRLDRVQVQML